MTFRQSGPIAGQGILLESSRLTQDALRTALGPLTSSEIAAAVMQAKGMPSGDVAFKGIVADRVLTVLRRLAKPGQRRSPGRPATPNGR
jgi:hypothetical protein